MLHHLFHWPCLVPELLFFPWSWSFLEIRYSNSFGNMPSGGLSLYPTVPFLSLPLLFMNSLLSIHACLNVHLFFFFSGQVQKLSQFRLPINCVDDFYMSISDLYIHSANLQRPQTHPTLDRTVISLFLSILICISSCLSTSPFTQLPSQKTTGCLTLLVLLAISSPTPNLNP